MSKKAINVSFKNFQTFKKAFDALNAEKETFAEAVESIVDDVRRSVRNGNATCGLYKAGDDTMLYNHSVWVDDGYCGAFDSLSFFGEISHVFSEDNEATISVVLTFNGIW